MSRSLVWCCHGERGKGRGVAASGCAPLQASHSPSLLSTSWFGCWVMTLGCHSYAVQDGGLRACWPHLLMMVCGMRSRMREEERGGSCRYQQQNLKTHPHSMRTVKERSPGCVAAGHHRCRGGSCPGCGWQRSGTSEMRRGPSVGMEREGQWI